MHRPISIELISIGFENISAVLCVLTLHGLPPSHAEFPLWIMHKLLLALLPLSLAPSAALAQKEIPKAPGFNQCPAGYVNTLGTTCVSPIYYEVTPTNGEACQAGWINIGAGYCKKKKRPLKVF